MAVNPVTPRSRTASCACFLRSDAVIIYKEWLFPIADCSGEDGRLRRCVQPKRRRVILMPSEILQEFSIQATVQEQS
jgi:hypothetical protein